MTDGMISKHVEEMAKRAQSEIERMAMEVLCCGFTAESNPDAGNLTLEKFESAFRNPPRPIDPVDYEGESLCNAVQRWLNDMEDYNA